MIKIKDLEKYYDISKDDNGNRLILYSLTELGSLLPKKYVGHIIKEKSGWYYSPDCSPTNDINILMDDVNNRLKSFKYNSEFYNPLFRTGLFEYMAVYDHLRNMGFKSGNGDSFYLSRKNIYGANRDEIVLSIDGLDYMDGISLKSNGKKEYVIVTYWTNNFSWVDITTNPDGSFIKRDPDEIIPIIDSLLKTIFMVDSSTDYIAADKLDFANIDVTMSNLVGVSTKSNSYKDELIKKLEETLLTLKNN
jgi:hypothetical protein